MRVGQLNPGTRNSLLAAGLFLIGLSSAVGLGEPAGFTPTGEPVQQATLVAPTAAPVTAPASPCQGRG